MGGVTVRMLYYQEMFGLGSKREPVYGQHNRKSFFAKDLHTKTSRSTLVEKMIGGQDALDVKKG